MDTTFEVLERSANANALYAFPLVMEMHLAMIRGDLDAAGQISEAIEWVSLKSAQEFSELRRRGYN